MLERDNNANVDVAPKIVEPSDPYGWVSYPKVKQCAHEYRAISSPEMRSRLTHPSCGHEDGREPRGVDIEVTRLEHQSDSICHPEA